MELDDTLKGLAGRPVDVGLLVGNGTRYDGRIARVTGETVWLVGPFGQLALRMNAVTGVLLPDTAETASVLGGPLVRPLEPGELVARARQLSRELQLEVVVVGHPRERSALAACGLDDNQYYTPIEDVLPYVARPEQVTPGTNSYFATTVGSGPHAYPNTAVHRPRGMTSDGPSVYWAEFNQNTIRQGVIATMDVSTVVGR